jgi:exodeoxyribonuclease VII small subunit
MSGATKIDAVGFEAAVQQLEQTVAELESGELGLDGALAKYQQGVSLLTRCYSLLDGAERVVAVLNSIDAAGNPETVAFDATATVEREATAEARNPAPTRVRPRRPRPNPETQHDEPPF